MDAGNLPYRKYCVFNKGWRICQGIRRGDVSKIHNFRNDMDDLAIHARPLDLAIKQAGPTPTRGRRLATSMFQAHLAGFAKDNEASSGSSRKKPRVHY